MRARSFLIRDVLMVALVSIWASAANATPYVPVFEYTRPIGALPTVTKKFEHCDNTRCQIVVDHKTHGGDARDKGGASISLNGSPIIGPDDFKQQDGSIVRPVALVDQNVLAVTGGSQPDGLTVSLQCLASPVKLSAGAPGVSLQPSGSLLSAVNIANTGTADAQNVRVTAISLDDGTLATPSLPDSLGTIPADGSAVLNANFSGSFVPGRRYELTVRGTYTVGSSTYCFTVDEDLTIPPAAPGATRLETTWAWGLKTRGPYPAQPRPSFSAAVNPAGWTVPIGPFVFGIPTPVNTATLQAPLGDALTFAADSDLGLAAAIASPIDFQINNGLGLVSGGANGQVSTTAEPSGGVTGGGVVFVTANWTAAYSTDGINFTQLDPTTIFPNDAVGFCCDQIVQYVPSIDRFFWLLQGNGYRLAMASPQQIIESGGTAWTYWNLTPQVFGEKHNVVFDYPDLSVGNNSLYLSWDGNGGFQVARVPLTGTNSLQGAGTITIGFTHPEDAPMAWGSHLTQNTGDEIFWAGHNNNSNMRIFSLREDSDTYFWRDRDVSTWANNAPTSLTPDGQDWLAKNFNGPGGNSFPRNGVIGTTRVGNQVWFAWTAGTDSNFQQPHVEMVTFDRGADFAKSGQVQIWNNDYAFAYPALATNACTQEVGLSFEYGGNGKYYENHVVGFWGDFIAYITTGSDVGTTRFGDYVTIRQAPGTETNPGNLFAAFGYGLNNVPPPGAGVNVDVRYVLFGRPAGACGEIIR